LAPLARVECISKPVSSSFGDLTTSDYESVIDQDALAYFRIEHFMGQHH